MPDLSNPSLCKRKEPRQARSTGLVAAILQAAAQVLVREGAARFTTARVAEAAGVSVGSLYQYFPNKAAILFRLQTDEWVATGALLEEILRDAGRPPAARLRGLVHAFVASEREEAGVRAALADAAPLYRRAPQAAEARSASSGALREFLHETLPTLGEEERAAAEAVIAAALSQVGKHLSQAPAGAGGAPARVDALADMLCAYLESLIAR